MKKCLNIFLLAAAAFAGVTACKKDEVRAVLSAENTPVLTSSASTLVLDSNSAANTAVTFSWDSVKYGYSAAVTYTLQFDIASDSFANPTEVSVGNNLYTKSMTVGALDTVAFQSVGLGSGTAGVLQVRIKADVQKGGSASGTSSVASVYSAAINLTVTPYYFVIVYPVVYTPGVYNGWDPPSATQLSSVKGDGNYEGYVYFPTSDSLEFKITPDANWNVSYGSGGTGLLSAANGVPNLTTGTAGYYRIQTNPTNLTWSYTKTTWGVIGSSVAGGSATVTAMTYDRGSKTWILTATLSAGTFKFQTSESASVYLGLKSGKLSATGSDGVTVTAAGSYTITLDLSKGAGNYDYTLVKN